MAPHPESADEQHRYSGTPLPFLFCRKNGASDQILDVRTSVTDYVAAEAAVLRPPHPGAQASETSTNFRA